MTMRKRWADMSTKAVKKSRFKKAEQRWFKKTGLHVVLHGDTFVMMALSVPTLKDVMRCKHE